MPISKKASGASAVMDPPLDERTIYLWHRVQAGPTELYAGLEWSLASQAILQATTEHMFVLHSIRRMQAWEVHQAFRGLQADQEEPASWQPSP